MYTFKKYIPLIMLIPVLLFSQFSTVKAAENDEPKVVEITGTDQMKFTVTDIQASPGQKIKVVLTTVSDYPKAAMAHNFVLLTAGADATKVTTAAAQARENEYIPENMDDQILAYTGMAGNGETVEVTFTAPEELGSYTYICSFPGHYMAGMTGTLTVKKPPIN